MAANIFPSKGLSALSKRYEVTLKSGMLKTEAGFDELGDWTGDPWDCHPALEEEKSMEGI